MFSTTPEGGTTICATSHPGYKTIQNDSFRMFGLSRNVTSMVAHQCHSILCYILTFFSFFNNFFFFFFFSFFFIFQYFVYFLLFLLFFFYSINKKKQPWPSSAIAKKKKKRKKQPWPRSAIAHDALRRSSHKGLGLKQHGGADKKRYVEM